MGGKHLNTSTPTSSSGADGVVKVYPPSEATTTTADSAAEGNTTTETVTESQDEPEPELVGKINLLEG